MAVTARFRKLSSRDKSEKLLLLDEALIPRGFSLRLAVMEVEVGDSDPLQQASLDIVTGASG